MVETASQHCPVCHNTPAPSPSFADPIRYGPIASPAAMAGQNQSAHTLAVVSRSAACQDTVHLLYRESGEEFARQTIEMAQVFNSPVWDGAGHLVMPLTSWKFGVIDANRKKYFSIASPKEKGDEFGRPLACICDARGHLAGLGITDSLALRSYDIDLGSRSLHHLRSINIPSPIPPALLKTLTVLPIAKDTLLLQVHDQKIRHWMRFAGTNPEVTEIARTSLRGYALRCEGDASGIAFVEDGKIRLIGTGRKDQTIHLPDSTAYATVIGVYASGDVFVGLVDRTGDHQLLHYREGLLERSVPYQMPAQAQRLHYIESQDRLLVLASSAHWGVYVCSLGLARRNVDILFSKSQSGGEIASMTTDWDVNRNDLVLAAGRRLVKISLSPPVRQSNARPKGGSAETSYPKPPAESVPEHRPPIDPPVNPDQPVAGESTRPVRPEPRSADEAFVVHAEIHDYITESIRLGDTHEFKLRLTGTSETARFRVIEVFSGAPSLYYVELSRTNNILSNGHTISVYVKFPKEGKYSVCLRAQVASNKGKELFVEAETDKLFDVLDPMRKPEDHRTIIDSGGGDVVNINRESGKSKGY
jgi:hypothetical protein